MLLQKAVEDCFIGRHFIFGIKVSKTQNGPWSGSPVGSNDKETANFIASQMILPQAPGLGGCTVVSYFQILLQKAAEYERSTDPSGITRRPETPLLLISHHSPAASFTFPSQLLPRSQPQDCTLSPTPPWQQSLGLVTSSAEQEEGCITLESGDERSTQTDSNKIPRHHARRICLGSQKTREDTVASSAFSLEYTWNSGTSFAKYLDLSVQRTDENSPTRNPCLSLSPPRHNSPKEEDLPAKTCLLSSLAWEDLPFSESLSEFLCEEKKVVNVVCERGNCSNVQNQRDNKEITGDNQNSTSVHHTKTLATTEDPAEKFLDITNTPAQNRGGKHDSSHKVYENLVRCLEKGPTRNICSLRGNNKDETASTQEELLEEDAYDCSADLFSSSLVDMSSVESVRMTTEDCSVITNLRWSEKADVLHLTPEQPRLRTSKCINRDIRDLDFIPPSQSTPVVKVPAVSKLAATTTPRSARRMKCERQSHRFTPKTRLWKPDKFRNSLLNWQHHSVHTTTPNRGSTRQKECDSSQSGREDSEGVIPPSPATKTKPSVNRGRRQTDNSSCDFASAKEEYQRDRADYKRTCRSSQRGLRLLLNETIKDDSLDSSVCGLPDYENEACDWSRDLFSDSV
ncbi:uncharacterized protein V6R79_026207 [Siganus canaliculatus]